MLNEREIFDAAIEIDDLEARNAFIDKSCSHDDALLRGVYDLLEFEQVDQSFLSEEQLATHDHRVKSLVGSQIGRYKLLEEIGEGGCGIVYMAEQKEPVRRKVALKIIKPGMDTREVIARFNAERQALAMMEHPNIARVLDGGETQNGRPYFVMELVNGVPLTEFCNANRMSPEQRLKLFIKVCRAVQHAHQKGIIHRDIKPSNVLVTLHDGEAVPRIIDFGVAKAIGQQLTENTLFTRLGQIVGTPQYMSPEQAERSGLDIDTRSDIYSLGVLLYELLTGQTPLDKPRFKEAAFDEVLRIVREEEPPPPSSRISTLGAEGTIIGQQRSTEPLRLGRLLRGDIDWIVMRALEKNRKRRFETVGDFIADIERHLANEPVLSGPPSAAYRAAKFVRRNRVGVAVASAVIGSLAVGFAVAIIGLNRANTEKSKAIASAQQAQTVLSMLREMLATDPEVGRGRDLTVRKMLDEFRTSLPDLSSQPKVAVEIHNILGQSYAGLDLFDEALAQFHQEYNLNRQVYGSSHAKVAGSAFQVAFTYRMKGARKPALQYSEIAVAMFDALGDYSEYTIYPRAVFCELLAKAGEPKRAEKILRRTIGELETRSDSIPELQGASRDFRQALAVCLAKQGMFAESLLIGEQALDDTLRHPSSVDSNKGWALLRYGDLLEMAGKTAAALDHYEQAHELFHPHYGTRSLALTTATERRVTSLAKLFRYDEAIVLWKDPLMLEYPMQIAHAFHQLVLIELDQGKVDAADRRCQEMLDRVGDSQKMAYPRMIANFLLALSKRHRRLEACQLICDKMLSEAKVPAAMGPETFSLVYSWVLLQKSNRTPNDVEDAIRHAKTAIDSSTQEYLLAFAHHNLALAYVAASDSEPGLEWQRLAIEQQQFAIEKMPKHHLFLRSELDEQMADLLESASRTSEARQFLRQGVKWREDIVPARNIHIADARMRLAEHLIEHRDGEDDLEATEKLLLHETHRSQIEARAIDDVFRTRWISLLINLYDAWEKPVERAKWEKVASSVP